MEESANLELKMAVEMEHYGTCIIVGERMFRYKNRNKSDNCALTHQWSN